MSGLIDEMIDHFTKLKAITIDTLEIVGESNNQLLVHKMNEITKYNSYIKFLANVANTSDSNCNIPHVTTSIFTDYDSGLINDYGGGDTGWWMDYIRSEVDAANEHWRQQLNIDE